MTTKHASQKRYPPELRERAVRLVLETVEQDGGNRFGVITRIARQLGVGDQSLRNWVAQAEVDGGQGDGISTEAEGADRRDSNARYASCGGPMTSSRPPRFSSRPSLHDATPAEIEAAYYRDHPQATAA